MNPELIKEGHVDGVQNEDALKNADTEEHIEYIRKVLGIVTVQMSFTFALCVLSTNFDKVGNFFKHPLTLILGFILMLTCVCYIYGSPKARKEVPLNYILLTGATLGEASFLAATAADLKEASVYMAIMATCVAVGALFCGAMYSASSVNRDVLIKNMIRFAVIGLIVQLFMTLVILFLYSPKDKALVLGITIIMLIVTSGYVMFALLFVIVPGLEDKDDYILGALRLYLEIARLFFWIMKLLGERKARG